MHKHISIDRFGSISEALTASTTEEVNIHRCDFDFHPITTLDEMIMLHDTRVRISNVYVNLDWYGKSWSVRDDPLGTFESYEKANETYAYTDGSYITCITVKDVGDTMGEHVSCEVKFFLLTPKK